MIGAICIVISFVLLATTLAWVMIWGRGAWWLRAALAAGTMLAGLAMWMSIGDVAGWPADSSPPESGIELDGIVIVEPSRDGADSGSIFVWGRPLVESESKAARWLVTLVPSKLGEPRCWRLPYSKSMHNRSESARRAIGQGRKVIMKGGRAPDGASALPGADGEEGGGQEGTQTGQGMRGMPSHSYGRYGGEDGFKFYDLPLGRLPKKDIK